MTKVITREKTAKPTATALDRTPHNPQYTNDGILSAFFINTLPFTLIIHNSAFIQPNRIITPIHNSMLVD